MTTRRRTLEQNIAALTKPRVINANITDARGAIQGIHSATHEPLIDLLENGTGTSRGTNRIPPGSRYLIDEDALELWGEIRDTVRVWGEQLKAPWFDDLSIDLQCWHEHHKAAAVRGRVSDELQDTIERTVARWVGSIERKYDPDRKIEFTQPCPAVFRDYDEDGGFVDQYACERLRVVAGGVERAAITINLTRAEAECLACGTKWEGERALRSLVWAAEDRERKALAALDPDPVVEEKRDLALTGPIDLP